MTDKTTLGDRVKGYEQSTTMRKAFKGQPLIVRLDGKNFHAFCKGLKRPFDERLSALMVEVTKYLVETFQARIGYTQSDEITLVWHYQPHETAEYPFAGRFQKMESLLAAYATAFFNTHLSFHLPEKAGAMPVFDARAFVVPNEREAYHTVLWRQQDCTKNAISMAAQSMFSHKSLQGLHGPEMQERMWKEKGVNFNDYPAAFKRGTFVSRAKVLRVLDEAELARIPEAHRPTGPVERTETKVRDIWLAKEDNTFVIPILFYGLEAEGTQAYLRSPEASKTPD
jgi:tRNA(His) 5'-end guanylyltransferase